MRYVTLPRDPSAFQQSLTAEQIEAVCARAFGPGTQVLAARELGGGEFNTIYAVRIAGRAPVILRVAPAADRPLPWHERTLMRREHSILPYFAPVASLLPRTLAVDFTHELIDRDYLCQTRLPGRQWRFLAARLSPEENASLLRQMASILRRIHAVRGTTFGEPWPGSQHPTWSATMLDWLDKSLAHAISVGVETDDQRAVLEIARAGAAALDEVREPRLLHGDLWTFNLLVHGGTDGPAVSAVLDYDRACWGDPLFEWTFHLLPRRASADEQAIFWEAYGRPPQDAATRFRIALYETFHVGVVLADLRRRERSDLLPRVYAAHAEALAALRALRP